jgi:hypothetical protein
MNGFACTNKNIFSPRVLLKLHPNIGERPYLTTKIITLSEFFNFVHQVSRL